MTAALATVLAARATAHGLPGAAPRPPTRPLDTAAWSALSVRVARERVTGPLAWAVAEGWWPATDDQAEQAARAHRGAMATCLQLERRLVTLAVALDDAGVRWCTLKGPASAHLDEVDPSLRSFGDIDVLVDGDDLAVVYHLLVAAGGERRYATRYGGYDRRYGKGAAHLLPDGTEVDVHRTLALGPYGLCIDPTALLDTPVHMELAGRAVPTLNRVDRFLHACVHAALGQHPARLTALRDVVLTAPRTGAEGRAAYDRICRWRLQAVVATALVDASRTLRWDDGGPLLTWATRLAPDRRDRRWLAAYRGPQASSWARTARAVEALPDGRSRLTYGGWVGGTGLAVRIPRLVPHPRSVPR